MSLRFSSPLFLICLFPLLASIRMASCSRFGSPSSPWGSPSPGPPPVSSRPPVTPRTTSRAPSPLPTTGRPRAGSNTTQTPPRSSTPSAVGSSSSPTLPSSPPNDTGLWSLSHHGSFLNCAISFPVADGDGFRFFVSRCLVSLSVASTSPVLGECLGVWLLLSQVAAITLLLRLTYVICCSRPHADGTPRGLPALWTRLKYSLCCLCKQFSCFNVTSSYP